ncbi:ATP-dependent transcriptional regulator [Brevibacillus ruminantium]|uniref:ATP-dependent transcriptional regulator n=1 Tax=Brevibacillus ruminantium TaxID=2950604 RepID=A0ABY4W9G4_9BACL|nr:BTAD domain-containing putative transcriptional regulator [Brevibacillus ruminantium]USG63822.1 ATP-dependent transcriptional regulator [Brevibacillus ruminantium]
MNASRISPTRITSPRLKPFVFHRVSLAKKLRLMRHKALTIVHAGAGYGKTTAIAAFLEHSSKEACWYRVGEKDDTLPVFLQHLLESIRSLYPAHGGAVQQALASWEEQSLEAEGIDSFVDMFIQACLELPSELTIVLDDFHHVHPDGQIDRWVQEFLTNMPQHIRVVILTRVRPAWPFLEVMSARGDFMEITVADLVFSREEMETFFLDEYDVTLSGEDWERIENVTQGWATAVRTIGETLALGVQSVGSASESSRFLPFLETEVWDKQTPELQAFLMRSAVFESFDAEDIRQVFGEQEGKRMDEVLRRHLFLLSKENRYAYHPLFRRLLVSKLAGLPEEYVSMHRLAAEWYKRKGEAQQGFEHLRLIEAWDELGEWLTQAAGTLLQAGKLDFLSHWLQLLPDEIKDQMHVLWFYQAEVERYRCLYPKALLSYRRYLSLCEMKQDVIGQCRGLEGLARVHLDSVQGVKAEELLKQAIQLLQPDDHEMAPRLFRLLAEIYTNRGDAQQAAHWYQRSQEWEQRTEVELESRLLFRTGRLQSAIELLESKWKSEQLKQPALTRSYRETSLLLAFVYGLNGEWEKGLDAAETAIQLGKAAHSPFVEANGYVRKATAALVSQQISFDQVRELYQMGLRIMEELQSTRGKSETLLGLTLLYGREANLDMALSYGQRGLQETEAMRDDWLNSLVRLAIGIAYATCGQEQQAEEWIRDCEKRLSRCGDSFGVAICHLWLSYFAYRQKEWNTFIPAVSQALTAIQTGAYHFLLQRPTMFTPHDVQQLMPVLIEAQRRQVSPDYVSSLLTDLGLQNVSFHPGYTLRIQTLGQFRLWLGERELGEKAWQRGKAKQLFQLLLTKRKHLLAREDIVTILWEESDEETATRDFKVALNALNKALEPNREARAHAFFIQRHGSSYGFNLASGFHIDVEEFERFVTLGLEANESAQSIVLLEKGLSFYKGDYLPDCRYEDWCGSERERLRVLFLRGAERLARMLLDADRVDEAIRWCESILTVDDCWEEAYRLLMLAYFRQNNRAQAIRWYEKCVANLQKQLGVQPMPPTVDTFRKIMEG